MFPPHRLHALLPGPQRNLSPFSPTAMSHRHLLRLLSGLTLLCGYTLGLAAEPVGSATPSSPIEWRGWTPELPGIAQAAGKPLYLFAGSRLNELSRATTRQSFANPETADFLNRHFICVQIDTDEHAALAAIIRRHLNLLHQAESLPVHLWLTPDLNVIEASAYLPPTEEWGKPSFLKVATQVADAWRMDPQNSSAKATEALAQLEEYASVEPPVPPDRATLERTLDDAAARWRQLADPTNGGFGEAPKYPQPELLRFLLTRPGADRDLAHSTLRRLASSALRDPLDGGFFRYATDPAWRLPYFQKLLGDQARLALAYLEADAARPDPALRAAARGALDYMLSRLALPAGGFATAEDGSGENAHAAFLWSAADLAAPLGPDAGPFFARHGVQHGGNLTEDVDPGARWKGLNVLTSALPDSTAQTAQLATIAALRRDRPAPALDSRAFLAPQGLALAALARAAQQYTDTRYREAAERLYAWLHAQLRTGPRLEVPHAPGSPEPATPADLAALAFGCRTYGEALASPDATTLTRQLLDTLVATTFDKRTSGFVVSPVAPGRGFLSLRTPAPAEPCSAEALALLAGLEGETAADLRAGLVEKINRDDGSDTGALLLALSRVADRQ